MLLTHGMATLPPILALRGWGWGEREHRCDGGLVHAEAEGRPDGPEVDEGGRIVVCVVQHQRVLENYHRPRQRAAGDEARRGAKGRVVRGEREVRQGQERKLVLHYLRDEKIRCESD